jgi:hypothetical protein
MSAQLARNDIVKVHYRNEFRIARVDKFFSKNKKFNAIYYNKKPYVTLEFIDNGERRDYVYPNNRITLADPQEIVKWKIMRLLDPTI